MIVIFTTIRVPSFIMAEAFLSFLGLGISAPMTSWGELVQNGIATFVEYPWKVFIPAIVMTIFLLFMNFLGDGLRDAFDRSIAGFFGGLPDKIITKTIEILYALPYLLIVIILMAIMERSIIGLFIALAFVSWLTVARVVRGQVQSLSSSEFIQAAKTLGATNQRIILKHLIDQC